MGDRTGGEHFFLIGKEVDGSYKTSPVVFEVADPYMTSPHS